MKNGTTDKTSNYDKPVVESGIIEGFYHKPWSRATRLRFLDFMAYAHFQTYIYAPKDDVYHRERWAEPYPKKERGHLLAIIRKCRELDIDFCWAISPGLSIRYSSRSDFDALAAKLISVADAGVTSFALLLDDVPAELIHKRDKKKWGSLAAAHAELANRLHDRLSSIINGARLFFCPTEYAGVKPTAYLETIGAEMTPEISVFWTGPLIVSPRVTAEDMHSITDVLRRKPVLWDNYPVNDYNRNKLNLGPLSARAPQVPELSSGYFANPMNEASASIIPLLTASAWLAAPLDYDPRAAWLEATNAPLGRILPAKARQALRDFCATWPSGFFHGETDSELNAAIAEAEAGRATALRRLLTRLSKTQNVLREYPALKYFNSDVRPYLNSLSLHAKAALLLIDNRGRDTASVQKKVGALLRRADQVGFTPTAVAPLRNFILKERNV